MTREEKELLRLSEDPPGLERVRRWLLRLWRFLRPAWLWFVFLAVRPPVALWKAGRSASRRPGVARAGRSAARQARRFGAPALRASAALARRGSNLGARLEGAGRNWSRAGGRLGRIGERFVRTGRRLRDGGARGSELGGGAAEVTESLGDLRDALADGPADNEDDDRAAPVGLGLGRGRLRTRPAPRNAGPPTSAPPRESGASPPPAPGPSPAAPKRHPPPPAAPLPRKRTPVAEPDLPPELPFHVRAQIRALGSRPRKEPLRQAIGAICAARDWTRTAELAAWLGVDPGNLAKRHLGPMVKAGLLERRFPDQARHRAQAYRAPRDQAGP